MTNFESKQNFLQTKAGKNANISHNSLTGCWRVRDCDTQAVAEFRTFTETADFIGETYQKN